MSNDRQQTSSNSTSASSLLRERLTLNEPIIQSNAELLSTASEQTDTSTTILIVDDTPNNLQLLFSYLETAGFKVLVAEDGETAIRIAQSQRPDLILLDVLMPNLDGFATCARLKSQPTTKEIPVIFLTALSETVNKVQGFELGGVDYITKPSEQEEVLARIQTHLNLRRMRRALIAKNRELQQALNFEALNKRITDKIRDSLDETYCLRVATQELATALNLSSCQVEIYNSKQTKATIIYEHSNAFPQCQGETRNINDFHELYQLLLQKSPVQLVEPLPQFNPQGIQVTRLACPIVDDRGIIGNLWGLRPPAEVFTSWEISLMQQVASQCAIAMRQARLYADSNRHIAELAKLNQLKDDFLKTVSHELKAPMSSIQLAAQTLESLLNGKQHKTRKSPIFKRVIEIFRASCQQQKQLIDGLVTLSDVEARTTAIELEQIELDSWLNELIQPYSRQAQNKKQELILASIDPKITVVADPVILERIIQELLKNAFKYTPEGGKITLQAQTTETATKICIINTGVEIAPEQQKLIFDQFYRIPNDDETDPSSGLGLTLVKKLAEILKATVEVESSEQKTIFCLKFYHSDN
jgi:signal transduction histidine kinase/DNA-binding response OmpR family regulator